MGGKDKSFAMLGTRPLVSHVIERLAAQTEELIISANGDTTRIAEFGYPVVTDSVEGFAGPLAGVLAGLDYAADAGYDKIVTAATDTPFFPPDFVAQLDHAIQDRSKQAAMAVTPDPERGISRHPTFAIWTVANRNELRTVLENGMRKMGQWADVCDCTEVEFVGKSYDPFFNVNTPDDMAVAEAMLKEATP